MVERLNQASERVDAMEEIQGIVNSAKERFFDSPFLEKTYDQAVKSLCKEGNPQEIVKEAREKVGEYENHLEFFYEMEQDFPEYFPDKIDVNFSHLENLGSLETLRDFRKDFERQTTTFLTDPEVEKVEIPIRSTEDGIYWKVNPQMGGEDYTPGTTPGMGEFLTYLGRKKG